MKSYIVKEGSFLKLDEMLTKNNQIAFTAWKQGNKIDRGTWNLHLVNAPYFKLDLGELEYYGNEDPGWRKLPIKWVDITKDGTSSC